MCDKQVAAWRKDCNGPSAASWSKQFGEKIYLELILTSLTLKTETKHQSLKATIQIFNLVFT